MEMINYDSRQPWEDLANGIIIQATHDYKGALKYLHNPKSIDGKWRAITTIHSINRFFRSHWFTFLTQVDPEYIIEQLWILHGNDKIKETVNATAIKATERI